MATILNDRDILLQAAATRVLQTYNNVIVATYSATKFTVNNTVVSPSTITITASLKGQLYGTPTFSIISGISSIDTTVPNQCTLAYANMTADTCTIRISLVFFGTTYTTDCIIEGKVTAPGTVSTITATPEVNKLKLSWTKNAEADVLGYEVRSTNSGWGTAGYLYHGSDTSCLITPGAVNVPTTWYVKAYDASSLFSTTAQTVSYTVLAPSTVTGVSSTWPATSNTTTSSLISWTPVAPIFRLDTYRVRIIKPDTSITDYLVANPFIEIQSDWIGTATCAVFVKDLLGNESLTSAVVNISKLRPIAPTVVSFNPIGTELVGNWTVPAKTTLPIAGYEVRKTNSGWGSIDTDFVWRGDSPTVVISSPILGVNSYYVNTFDTDGKYALTGTLLSQTTYVPGPPTIPIAPTFSTSANTTTTITINWVAPVITSFAISKYIVSVVKPSIGTETVTINSTNITIEANWIGSATVSITSVDVLGVISATAATINITKSLPNDVGAISYSVAGTDAVVTWPSNTITTLPIAGYEIRSVNANWGTNNAEVLWKGNGNTYVKSMSGVTATPGSPTNVVWYIKAFDTDNKYSTNAITMTTTVTAPTNTSIPTHSFGDSLTSATITLDWTNVTPQFGLAGYEVIYDSISTVVNATSIILPADWIGNRIFTVKTIDNLGNKSSGVSITIAKLVPNIVDNFRAQVIDNNVLLYWTLPAKTSLPITSVRLKKGNATTGTSYASSVSIGDKTGTFTSLSELSSDIYTYWIVAVDTDNRESTPVSVVSSVSQPADFVFTKFWSSDFTIAGTLVNAIRSTSADKPIILLPTNTTETFAAHFTSLRVSAMTVSAGGTGYAVGDTFRLNTGTASVHATAKVLTISGSSVATVSIKDVGNYTVAPAASAGATTTLTGVGSGVTINATSAAWSMPAAQISSPLGLPYYANPGINTGSYEEVFDYGQVIASTQITSTLAYSVLSGAPKLLITVSTSLSAGSGYTDYVGVTSVFATNFRYVKVKVGVTQDTSKDLIILNSLGVRLDAKLKNDAGTVSALSSDTNGTIVNFTTEFLDVTSVVLTALNTVAITTVYDFKDTVITGTYSLVSNVCTVDLGATAHGLLTGQRVRLSFPVGGPASGTYIITYIDNFKYSVSITSANASGAVSTYSNSMRVYGFINSTGLRATCPISWAIKGY